MPIDASILEEVEHLKDLNAAEREALAERIDLLKFAAGETIFSFGDPGHALYIVRAGEVEIYIKNDNGEKIVVETAASGDVFGEISLIDNGPRTAWVAAIGDVEVLRLDREHFEDYVRLYTPAALNLLSVTARRLRKSDEFIRRTVARNANDVTEEQGTALTRLADAIPALTGNVPSVILHCAFFTAWILINVGIVKIFQPFDPEPFGLLSMIVAIEAIFLTLFVLSTQNRQRARDRIRSDIEFETSMNTELKIAYLHEKVDKLAESNYELLVNTQRLLDKAEPRA